MATTRQKLVIGKMVEMGGTGQSYTLGGILVEAGYSPNTALTPAKVLKSKGFVELADEYLPDDMLLEALQEDIKLKKGNRHKELDLAFKVKGKLTPNADRLPMGNTFNTQINVNDSTPRGQDMVDQFTEYMRQQTLSKDVNNG